MLLVTTALGMMVASQVHAGFTQGILNFCFILVQVSRIKTKVRKYKWQRTQH